jgi:hypothetical protein
MTTTYTHGKKDTEFSLAMVSRFFLITHLFAYSKIAMFFLV